MMQPKGGGLRPPKRAVVAGIKVASRLAAGAKQRPPRGPAPGGDVAARRNGAVASTDRSTETVHASSQSGQA